MKNNPAKMEPRELAKWHIRDDVKHGLTIGEIRSHAGGKGGPDYHVSTEGAKILVREARGKEINQSFDLREIFFEVLAER